MKYKNKRMTYENKQMTSENEFDAFVKRAEEILAEVKNPEENDQKDTYDHEQNIRRV